MKLSLFAALAQVLAPIIIKGINPKLAPIADAVGQAVSDAEQLPGASGPDKLTHVLNVAKDAVTTTNAIAGRQVVDPSEMSTVTNAVNATVEVLNAAQTNVQASAVLPGKVQ